MKKILLFLFALVTMATHAQTPGDIAQTFNGIPYGFDGNVYDSEIQADGKIVVVGNFSTYNGIYAKRIARLNTDGTLDTTFNPGNGFNDVVHTVAIQSDGKILVGGDFTTFDLAEANRFIRLGTTGTKDPNFYSGIEFNNAVYTIEVQSNGKILVGGNFTNYNNIEANRIIRLDTDASIDTTFVSEFNSVIYSGFNGAVFDIEIINSKIFVAGNFTTYNDDSNNRIISLNTNGTINTAFNTGSGFNATTLVINKQTDGKILVGGGFTSYRGSAQNKIVRINTDGTKDTTFGSGTEFNNSVRAIEVQADGRLLVGGDFTTYNGAAENYIIRLNTSGTNNTTFNTGTGFNSIVRSIALQADGKIIVLGNYTSYKGISEIRNIRLNTDGTKDPIFNTGEFNNSVRVTEQRNDGKILVGGDFTSYKGLIEKRFTSVNTDGTLQSLGLDFGNTVSSIEEQDNGKIMVGGAFSSLNGANAFLIVRLNSNNSVDGTFNTTGTSFDNIVRIIKTQPNGKILVGGDFTVYKGITANRIIRLNSDGTKDTSFTFGTGFNNTVYDIEILPDGKILVGGDFTTFNGVTVNRIVRLNTDGSLDTSFTSGTAFNNTVFTIEQQTDDKILVGGLFTMYNGTTTNRIVRLNIDGTLDSGFNTGTGFNAAVRTIEQQTDGKIVVGGSFTNYNGITENRIITLNADGTKNTAFITGSGFDGDLYSIKQLADGNLLVGGNFTTYNGNSESGNLITLYSETGLNVTIWNGTAWSNGIPDVTKVAIINGDYNLNTSISANILTVNATKVLTINPGILLNVTGKLYNMGTISFKSDATGSGIFDKYLGGNIKGSGTVIIERFIPAKRAFRFVCSAVTTTLSILNTWQFQRSTYPGYGTHITGGSYGIGFDETVTNNPSMFTWNNTTQNWSAVTNTYFNTLTAGTPYRLMVRGDRTIDLSTNTPTPTNTVLRATGKLHVGNYSPSLNSAIDGFSFIGNPYQSVVDMKAVLTASTNMKNDALYYWDPTLNTRGAYVTRDLITNTNSITSAFNEFLQPGQAVFVQKDNTVNVPTLTITENNKATSQATAGVFRVQNTQVSNTSYLKIELTSPNVSAVLDGSLLQFDAAYSWNVSSNDFIKLANQDEQLGFKLENKLLAIAKKSVPLNQDEVPLEITNYRQTNYQFNFDLVNYNGPTPYLFDTLDASYTEINDTTSKSFIVDTQNTLTTNPNRFKIVFNNAALSAAEFDFAAIKLYPNPIKANEKQAFTLSNIEENTTVNLFNSLGQEILVKTIYESGNVIVSATTVLSNGFYTVVVKTPSGNAKSFKLIVE